MANPEVNESVQKLSDCEASGKHVKQPGVKCPYCGWQVAAQMPKKRKAPRKVNNRSKGSPTRDNQKQKLYNAEREAFKGLPCNELHDLSVADCQAFIDKIVNSRWWRGRYTLLSSPEVKSGKGARWATARPYEHSIVLPLWARKPWVMLHELAHYAPEYKRIGRRFRIASHGPEFAKEYLALVERWIGKKEADLLRAAYKTNRVKYRVG